MRKIVGVSGFVLQLLLGFSLYALFALYLAGHANVTGVGIATLLIFGCIWFGTSTNYKMDNMFYGKEDP